MGEEGAEEAPAPEAPAADKHKRSGGFQRKIDRLERQNQQLMEMLQRGAAPAPPAPEAPPQTPQEKAAAQMHAFINQRVQEELAQRDAATKQQRLQADLQTQLAAARVAHPDFDEALADVSHINVPRVVHDAILTSDAPGEIMYSLAKRPAELARISALPPLDAVREIGRLEAKLASGAAPQAPKPAARPPSPPSKVTGSSAPSTRRWDDLPLAEHKRAHRSK